MIRLECEGRFQELVEGILGLGSESSKQPPPTAARAQDLREELVGRHEIRLSQKLRQRRPCLRIERMLVGAPEQLAPKPSLAAVSQCEEPLLIEAEERPFQHRR